MNLENCKVENQHHAVSVSYQGGEKSHLFYAGFDKSVHVI
jgi:hypothetical protein